MTVKNMMQFLHQVKSEVSKVVWPKTDEFIGSTVIVLFLVSVFAIYLGAVDLALSKTAAYVFKHFGSF